jgi:hypothetical protein
MISSTCCGQEEHADVPGMCGRCLDWAGFEIMCDECGDLIVDVYGKYAQGHYLHDDQDLCLGCFNKLN